MVSARRLRKSYDYDIDLDFLDLDSEKLEKIKLKKDRNDYSIDYKFKNKFTFKIFICSIILFICSITKLLFFEELKQNYKLFRIYEHYKFDFSKELVLENFEDFLVKKEYIINNIIPHKFKELIVYKYLNNIKKYIINFSFIDLFKNKNIDIYDNVDIYKKLGVGGGEPFSKSINIKKSDDKIIPNVNDEFINPTEGIVTSRFGNREVIFEGINPYHTGIDIANKEGTDIVSASNGKVSKVRHNDKFYGNYIVIEFNEYKFKYAHLKEILVKENTYIKKGNIIGKMGSTGLSTGPHLHFEVIVNDIIINPEEKFRF